MKILKQFLQFLRNNYLTVLLWFAFIIFLEVFSFSFISKERYVYMWDYAAYHDKYIFLGNVVNTGIQNFFRTVHTSLSDDYSLLAVVPLLPLRLALGPGRIAYIVSILTTYGVPSFIMFAYMVNKSIVGKSTNLLILSLAVISTIFLNPLFMLPIYQGYVNVFGTGFICFLYVYYFLGNRELTLKDHMVLGILLGFFILFRRWYGYWVFSFVAVLFCFQIYKIFKSRSKPSTALLALLGKYAATIYSLAALILIVAAPFFVRALTVNYADIYSVFRNYPLLGFRNRLYEELGIVSAGLVIFGIGFGLYNPKLRSFSFFILTQSILTLFIFTRVQNVLDHQYYQFFPTVMFFMTVSIYYVLELCNYKTIKYIFGILVVVYSVANFIIVFSPSADKKFGLFQPVFAPMRYGPLVRTDFAELDRLTDTLEQLNKSVGGTIYVLSYSFLFNDETLRHYCTKYANNVQFCSVILSSSGIDKRDGFPVQLFGARFILITDPIWSDSVSEKQHVVDDLAVDFLHGGAISKSFERLPTEFLLDNNVKVYIYKKRSTIPEDVINNLSKTFLSYYPDNNQFKFSANTINQKGSYEGKQD